MEGRNTMSRNLTLALLVPLMALIAACSNNNNQKNNDARRAAFIQVNKMLDSGNVDSLGNYIKEDAVDHQAEAMGETQQGLAGIKELFTKLHQVYPDMHTTIHSMAFSGDTMFAWVSSTGTLAQPFMGMAAGQTQTVSNVDVIRFDGDKMAEHWGFTDMSEMMKMQQQDTTMNKMGPDSTGNMMK